MVCGRKSLWPNNVQSDEVINEARGARAKTEGKLTLEQSQTVGGEAEVNQLNVAMEVENQTAFTSCCPSQNSSSSSSTPDVLPPENHDDSLIHHVPRLGTVIPNRIFVGGIDYKVNESDLRHVFSQHGAVKEVKIVIDRSGMSKGYGFVTFETQDDALKILHDANGICFKDKKLSIGQAVRKQQASVQTKSAPVAISDSAMPLPMSCGAVYLTTSTGNPYTYHNGVAYFSCPNMSPPGRHWPPAPPVLLPQSHQPVYQQPAYHHYQCVPNQYQWNVVQSPMPSSPVVYSQQSEYLYQPANGGSVQPPLPVMEDTTPEFLEPTVQQVYSLYPQRTEGMTPIVLQHDPGKNLMFPHLRVHLKPKYRRYIHHKDYHYLPEATEPPDASMLHTSQPLM
ncbi:protein boule-like isoform X2 [Siniperca chuatsi]|uniref:protein boule-like isoform X2 n=1 Tax=Siniperca chuatsi TaxID=119488 RepID=UPI001CE1F305|nr:protein boule-like isoform X2 [Siniperca chuatsi]